MNKLLLFGLLWLLSLGTTCQQSHDDPAATNADWWSPSRSWEEALYSLCALLLMMKITCECPETVLHPEHIARWRYFELHWSMWSGLWHHGWSAMSEGSFCTGVGLNRGGLHCTTSGSFPFISISYYPEAKHWWHFSARNRNLPRKSTGIVVKSCAREWWAWMHPPPHPHQCNGSLTSPVPLNLSLFFSLLSTCPGFTSFLISYSVI